MKIGIYFTIGDLGLNNSIHIFKGLIQGGVDLLEIGIPFSDPLLDGITIQQSHTRACLLYTSPSPRDGLLSRMPSSA